MSTPADTDLIVQALVNDSRELASYTLAPWQVSIADEPQQLPDGRTAYWVDVLDVDDNDEPLTRTIVSGILAAVVGGVVYWNGSPDALCDEHTELAS